MLPEKIAFVDLETTGGSTTYDRIIEIGIVRVENNVITQTYTTLLNPETRLSPDITRITGINDVDLENAPTFSQVAETVQELLKDCVFVAHNVRFDYGFLKSEFKRLGITYSSKHFCTVKLSRHLFPHELRHNLDMIIQRFGITCARRHRALDDAEVLHHFYQKLQTMIEPDRLLDAINVALKRPSLPSRLQPTDLDNLPEEPGVYIFYGDNHTPLYVGKSKNIRERVLSHFADDIRSSKEMQLSQQLTSIETHVTAGELGALLLESKLVKAMLPLYNRKLRLKRELIALKRRLDEHGYETVYLEPIQHISPTDVESFLTFFNSRRHAKTFLADLAKEFQLCEKLLGLEKTKDACFGYRLDQCKGACVKKEQAMHYNLRFLTAFGKLKLKQWPFPSPIMVEEKNPFSNITEYFLLDRWCYMGRIRVDHEGNENQTLETAISFDLDIYKILMQYFKHQRQHYNIHLLTADAVKKLGLTKELFGGSKLDGNRDFVYF